MAQDEHLTWRQQLLGGTADDGTMAAGDWAPVADDAETYVAQPAWSQNASAYDTQLSPIYDYPPTGSSQVPETHKPWTWAVTIVTAIVLLGMVAALGMLAWRHDGTRGFMAAPTTVTVTASAPSTVPAPTIAAPSSRAIAPDPAEADDTYLGIVESNGILVYDKPPMIKLGHQQCALLTKGETVSDAIKALEDTYSDFRKYPREAYGIVMGAVTAYCPQFKEGG